MFDKVEQKRGCESCFDNVWDERGRVPDHLSTERNCEEHSVDVDGLHGVLVDEDASEIEGGGVHEEDQRLREGEYGSVSVSVFQIRVERFPQVLAIREVELLLAIQRLDCADMFDSLGSNFSGFFEQLSVSNLLSVSHLHLKVSSEHQKRHHDDEDQGELPSVPESDSKSSKDGDDGSENHWETREDIADVWSIGGESSAQFSGSMPQIIVERNVLSHQILECLESQLHRQRLSTPSETVCRDEEAGEKGDPHENKHPTPEVHGGLHLVDGQRVDLQDQRG